jgi:FkbM family methyltransferase
MANFKIVLQQYLCRFPNLYANLLNLMLSKNKEKVCYLRLIKRNDVVIELGANRGFYTSLFSNIVGKNGLVYGFEAVPSTYQILRKNVSTFSNFKNYKLINKAVADENSSRKIYLPNDDDGQASLQKQEFGSWKGGLVSSLDCKVVRLDDYFAQQQISKIDFVKCDIEGAELFALKGMKQLLAKYKPILFLEICAQWTKSFGYKPSDILEFLKQNGYNSFCLAECGSTLHSYNDINNIEHDALNLICR